MTLLTKTHALFTNISPTPSKYPDSVLTLCGAANQRDPLRANLKDGSGSLPSSPMAGTLEDPGIERKGLGGALARGKAKVVASMQDSKEEWGVALADMKVSEGLVVWGFAEG